MSGLRFSIFEHYLSVPLAAVKLNNKCLDLEVTNAYTFLHQEKDTEITVMTHKVEQLEAELQDLSSQESKDEASLAKVKKQLRDLEAKVKDQEEELDEQAGSIQMLEQVKKTE